MTIKRDRLLRCLTDATHNELVRRGYSVDVGVVPLETRTSGKHEIRQHEIDFVVNKADERIYIQSAYMIPDQEKRAKETLSLRHVGDNFRKVVITGNLHEKAWRDENGIVFIGAMTFLLNPRSLETL